MRRCCVVNICNCCSSRRARRSQRHDREHYRTALARARQWLGDFFDVSTPAAQALLDEVQALEPLDIDPPLARYLGLVTGAATD